MQDFSLISSHTRGRGDHCLHYSYNLGDSLNITCSVIRGNPDNYDFSFTNIDSGITVRPGPTLMLTDIMLIDLGTYRCDLTNGAGTGSDTITIELGS